jgi:hypothetical protein
MLQYIHRDNKYFNQLWNDFTETNSNTSWHYLLKRVEFYKLISGERLVNDISFIVLRENKPIAISALLVENINSRISFSLAGGYLPAPLISEHLKNKDRKNIQNLCFENIDKLAVKHKAAKVMLKADVLTEYYSYNFLMSYNYLDTSSNTCLIDLNLPLTDLWSKIRKSYKSLINNGKKKYILEVYDYSNYDYDVFNLHKMLHHKTSGKVTRSSDTWDIQFDLIKDDKAILIGLKDGDKYVGFSYFAHSHLKAYYGNSSDDPEYETNIPLEHTIIWTAVEYYSRRNYNTLELGQQKFSSQIFDYPTQKELNISFFKRGFSDSIYRIPCGIKYYDKDILYSEVSDHLSRLVLDY